MSCLSFAVLSDSHIIAAYPDQFTVSLRQAVSEINIKRPVFLMHLGDAITGGALEAAVDQQWGWLAGETNSLLDPIYFVRGNHDAVSSWTRAQNIVKWQALSGMSSNIYSFDSGDFHIIAFDCDGTTEEELSWLEADLACTSKKVVFFSHYPVITYTCATWQPGNPQVQAILEAHATQIIAAFDGHFHENVSQELNGIKYYAVPFNGYDSAWEMITVYSTGEIDIRGYHISDSYKPSSAGYLAQHYSHVKFITILNATVTEDLIDYPVRVHLTTSNFDFSKAKDNGDDIRFSDGASALAYEIEHWDSAGEDAVIWVKVPMIPASVDTKQIYMYYGNSQAGTGECPKEVWGNTVPINLFNSIDNVVGTSVSVLSWKASGKYPVIGVNILRDTVASPVAGTIYKTQFTPSSPLDFSAVGAQLVSWLSVSRASTAFTSARIYVYDASGNYRYQDISFAAGDLERKLFTVASGVSSGTPPDLAAVTKISWELEAADTTPFSLYLDLCYMYVGYSVVLHFNESAGAVLHNSTRMADYRDSGVISNGSWASRRLVFNGSSTKAVFAYGDEFNCHKNGYTVKALASSGVTTGVKILATYETLGSPNIIPIRLHTLEMVPRMLINDGIDNNSAIALNAMENGVLALMSATFDLANMVAHKDALPGTPVSRTAVVPFNVNSFFIGVDSVSTATAFWNGAMDELFLAAFPQSGEVIKADKLNLLGGYLSFSDPARSLKSNIAGALTGARLL